LLHSTKRQKVKVHCYSQIWYAVGVHLRNFLPVDRENQVPTLYTILAV